MKSIIRQLSVILFTLVLAAGILTACSRSSSDGKDGSIPVSDESTSSQSRAESSDSDREVPGPKAEKTFRSTFIKCGKADMIVLEGSFGTVVIDTGEAEDGDKLVEYLEEAGADKVSFLIITHFDKDHVGGASYLLDHYPVGKIYIPDYEGTSQEYYEFMDKLKELDYREGGEAGGDPDGNGGLIRLHETVSFTAGDVRFTIDPPGSYEIPSGADEYDNDFSLITIAEHGSTSMLFMGDAENVRDKEFIEKNLTGECDLIKIPHHGRYHSQLKKVISSLRPSFAVITDSKKNPAEEKTLDLLADYGVKVFSTAEENVTAASDGTVITIS